MHISVQVGTYEFRGWPTPGKKKKKAKRMSGTYIFEYSGDSPRLVKRKRKKEIITKKTKEKRMFGTYEQLPGYMT